MPIAIFVHYPTEKWFPIEDEALLPLGILDDYLWDYFDPNQELTPELLVDLQSGNYDRGIVAMPYVRQSDQETVYIPQVSLRICMCLTECLPVTQKMKHACKGFLEVLNVT